MLHLVCKGCGSSCLETQLAPSFSQRIQLVQPQHKGRSERFSTQSNLGSTRGLLPSSPPPSRHYVLPSRLLPPCSGAAAPRRGFFLHVARLISPRSVAVVVAFAVDSLLDRHFMPTSTALFTVPASGQCSAPHRLHPSPSPFSPSVGVA